MSEMVERVARALCKADGWDNPDTVLAIDTHGYPAGAPVPDVAVPVWRRYRGKARAAIEAMREPTETMTNAALLEIQNAQFDSFGPRYWRAMIEAALGLPFRRSDDPR